MTINVVLKCTTGLVLGCDSLVTLSVGGQIRYMVNYANKLFAFASYPVGAVLNGAGNIGGRPMADIVRQFVKNLPEYDEDTFVLQTLVSDLRDALALEYQSAGSDARFELIIAGFTSTNRFGEIYSVEFPSASITSHYPGDQDFGIHYGGQSIALERFLYGFDHQHILDLYQSFEDLFSQARDYILEELRTQSINIPDDLIIQTPPIARFNIFSGVSHIPVDQQTTVKDILEGSRRKYSIPFRFLSLQEAITLVVFLMQCAYAEQNLAFTDSGHPAVGSEMTVATITREEGLPNLKTYYQPCFRDDADDFYECARQVGPYIANVHAQNVRRLDDGRVKPCAIADGIVDYEKIAAILTEYGYDGYLEVEFVYGEDKLTALKKDRDFLANLKG